MAAGGSPADTSDGEHRWSPGDAGGVRCYGHRLGTATFSYDDDGHASTKVDAGDTPGTVTVRAVCGSVTRTASLQVTALPQSLPDTGFSDQPNGVGLVIVALLVLGLIALLSFGGWRLQSGRR